MILDAIATAEPSPCGHAPVGYGMMCRHVDDRVKIVTSKKILEYQLGVFKHVYAMKTTGWKKVLGWTAVVDKAERTLTWECPGVLLAAGDKYLKGQTFARNRHVMLPSIMDIPPAEHPPLNTPEHDKFIIMQEEF